MPMLKFIHIFNDHKVVYFFILQDWTQRTKVLLADVKLISLWRFKSKNI